MNLFKLLNRIVWKKSRVYDIYYTLSESSRITNLQVWGHGLLLRLSKDYTFDRKNNRIIFKNGWKGILHCLNK